MSIYTTEFLQNKLLVKGDFSGIQEFIFNTPYKRAAKILKGKSFYIQALSVLAVKDLLESIKDSDLIYDGGGNFYLLIPEDKITILNKKKKSYTSLLISSGLSLVITELKYNVKLSYAENLKILNQKAQINSLNKLSNIEDLDFFKPYSNRDENGLQKNEVDFSAIGEWVSKSTDYLIEKTYKKRSIVFENWYYNFSNSGELKLKNDINAYLPKYEERDLSKVNSQVAVGEEPVSVNGIVTFDHIALFAKERTGTDFLGILSLDLDNLGQIIRNDLLTIDENKEFSKELAFFFKTKLLTIISDKSFTHNQKGEKQSNNEFKIISTEVPFSKCIYPVFAGGDDCLLVGAWDAILEINLLIKESFDSYVRTNKILSKYQDKLTFSVGIVLVNRNFPVNQFSSISKEALSKAKKAIGKNHISFLDYILSWEDWNEIMALRTTLQMEIIKYNAPKGMLKRFKEGQKLYDQLQSKMLNEGIIELAVITDFFYGLRDYVPKKIENDVDRHKEEFVESLIKKYKGYLEVAFTENKPLNSLIIPLASRWVEYLTKDL